jgi:hypothetical protein
MEEISDRVELDGEVALVDVDHERQRIHVLEHGTVGRVPDPTR